jgi:alpha-methylacyl-CoA racemase
LCEPAARAGGVTGGPLAGVKVVEIESIGPGPFAGMLLADLGADVFRVLRPRTTTLFDTGSGTGLHRGRASLTLDLKQPSNRDFVLEVVDLADVLIEGYRPGVMERLGLGPRDCHARNPRLVYGRVTGYGQNGPMAHTAGHDINYIALAGVLGAIARRGEKPLFPLNLLGDYAGGAMLLVVGVVCALVAGEGQVVDAAMVDGAALLGPAIHDLAATDGWCNTPGSNALDSGAHFYEVYETADGGFIAVGAIEPQFYAKLLSALEIDPAAAPQWDRARWPALKDRFAAVFRTRTRDEWAARLEHLDACATPVLRPAEAAIHPHNLARKTFFESRGAIRPAPAPRFSRTPCAPAEEIDPDQMLRAWGARVPKPA